jgi:hypothetical protein
MTKSKGEKGKGKGRAGSPKKKGENSGDINSLGYSITFADFVEIIFEIS